MGRQHALAKDRVASLRGAHKKAELRVVVADFGAPFPRIPHKEELRSKPTAVAAPSATPVSRAAPPQSSTSVVPLAVEARRVRDELAARAAHAVPFLTATELEQAEHAVEHVATMRRLALRVTARSDWQDLGGRPYLNHSGSMKVAALFGVSLIDTSVAQVRERVDAKEVIRYVAKTTARFGARAVEAEGVASSDDRFFSRKAGKPLPLSEVDLNSVRKKAVTNAQSRAVKMLLGLGGISWDEVRAAGVPREQVAAAVFGAKGGAGAPPVNASPVSQAPSSSSSPWWPSSSSSSPSSPSPSSAPAPSSPVDPIAPSPYAPPPSSVPDAQLSREHIRLRNYLVDMAAFEDAPFARVLRMHTSFRGRDGEERFAGSIESMSPEWVRRTLERVEPLWRGVPGVHPGRNPRAERSARLVRPAQRKAVDGKEVIA